MSTENTSLPLHSQPISTSRRGSTHTTHIPSTPPTDNSGLPVRHPRPLTPAEIHQELEKEQEAIVNRLTRELTSLKAHSATVASLDAPDLENGPTHPMSISGRQRSESSASASHLQPQSTPSSRYEEVVQQRLELEAAKKENVALRDRVKELEALLRERQSDTNVRTTTATNANTTATATATATASHSDK